MNVFFDYLLLERKVNFHPDTDFSDYVSLETGQQTFTKEEVAIFNRLMDEAFEICKKNNVDIYEIGINKLWTLLNISPKD